MTRLSLFFLIGTAMIGIIGMARSGTASPVENTATIDVDVFIKLLGEQDNINLRLFFDVVSKIHTKGYLTAEVVQALVKASCSSATGDGIISVEIIINLLNILKRGTLLKGSVISVPALIKIIATVILGPTC